MIHLVIKFQPFAWNKNSTDLITIEEHKSILEREGTVWWGRMASISSDKFEQLQDQLANGDKTHAFLYEIKTPTAVHPDRIRWYRASIKSVCAGRPENQKLIPKYYQEADLGSAFLLTDIEAVNFEEGKSPKVG